MKVKDLNGNISTLQLKGYIAKAEDMAKSDLHLKARELLKSLFPTLYVLEEVPITIRRGQTLYLDFFIPDLKIIIETHGSQHYKFNTYYHKSAQDFIMQKKRDKDKQEWCYVNGFKYIELPYTDSVNEWEQKILS